MSERVEHAGHHGAHLVVAAKDDVLAPLDLGPFCGDRERAADRAQLEPARSRGSRSASLAAMIFGAAPRPAAGRSRDCRPRIAGNATQRIRDEAGVSGGGAARRLKAREPERRDAGGRRRRHDRMARDHAAAATRGAGLRISFQGISIWVGTGGPSAIVTTVTPGPCRAVRTPFAVSSKAVLAGTANCTWLVPARVAKARMNGGTDRFLLAQCLRRKRQRDGRRTRCRDKARTAAVGRGSLIQSESPRTGARRELDRPVAPTETGPWRRPPSARRAIIP